MICACPYFCSTKFVNCVHISPKDALYVQGKRCRSDPPSSTTSGFPGISSTPHVPISQIPLASIGFCASRRRPDESKIDDGFAQSS